MWMKVVFQMSKKNKRVLSYEEQQKLDYMDGHRVGGVTILRRALSRTLMRQGRKSGIEYKPSKALLKKINREIDETLMLELVLLISKGNVPVDFLEDNYDRLFMLPDYSGDEKTERKFDPIPLQGKEILYENRST